jgi:hypothetical protein
MPAYTVSTRWQRLQTDAHRIAADLGPALIDAGAVGIRQLDRAESGFQVLRIRQQHLMRRRRHRAADQRAGVIEESVSMRDEDAKRRKKKRQYDATGTP